MKDNNIFSELSRFAGDVVGIVNDIKNDIEKTIFSKITRHFDEKKYVTREEFEILKKMFLEYKKQNEIKK